MTDAAPEKPARKRAAKAPAAKAPAAKAPAAKAAAAEAPAAKTTDAGAPAAKAPAAKVSAAKAPAAKASAAKAPKDPSGLPSRAPRSRSRSAAAADNAVEPVLSDAEEAARRQALELAHRVVDLAADKKAFDIVLLELNGLTTLTDYFVICSGGSERQLQSIADGVVEGLRDDGHRPIGREGGSSAHWLLVDYGSVILHVMAQPERDYYGLEKLWAEAPLLLRVL